MDPENEKAWYANEEGALAPLEEREKTRRRKRQKDDTPDEKLPHQIVLQGLPINLDNIEYKIVTFLASRPYHAFKTEEIIAHVNEKEALMESEALHDHITSLRSKMGFFRDYVQSVPHIGYRFKP